MPRYVVADDEEHQSDSSEEEEEAEEQEEDVEADEDDDEEQQTVEEAPAAAHDRKKIKLSLKQKNKDVCHVCGKSGHTAGFINGGSVYLDCPNKPCYLCKQPGHTTATCPHRIAPEHGCVQAASASQHNMLGSLARRERDGRQRETVLPEQRWQVEAAVLKLLTRRCTCLEFHPTRDNIVLAGDKKGMVAVWDFEKVYERTVYKIHHALANNIRFLPGSNEDLCVSAASDGFVKIFDLDLGESSAEVKLNLNPDGWIPGVTKEKDWKMLHGLDVNTHRNIILAGDTLGRVNCIDPRESKPFAQPQLHRKDKIVSVHANPADSNLLLTASNDHTARITDMRCLSSRVASPSSDDAASPSEVACMEHPKVVNSAYFSPRSGTKILTTCIDNRLRVWDNLYSANGQPDREIVHSHDFNRHLTPFRAEWDAKDPFERMFICGRYISEDFSGTALHPIDMYDASSGRLLCQLTDANLTTICPVNKVHPRQDVIVTGSSRSLYAWRPKPSDEEEEKQQAAAADARREETGQFRLDGAGTFLFFDADDSAAQKKKRKAAADDDGGGKAKGKKK